MPELPEVETVRRDLQRLLRGRRIKEVMVTKVKIVRGDVGLFKKKLKGQVVQKIKRRGKLLIFSMSSGAWLLVHMKMTGQLIYRNKKMMVGGGHGGPLIKFDELPNKYSHIIIAFSDGGQLFFNDMRQFGYMQVVNERQLVTAMARFGVEPLTKSFTADKLSGILRRHATAVKNVLLDQRGVAGLGNIYVDEACYLAGIKPTRRAKLVSVKETEKLHKSIVAVLKKSIIARGTTFSSYRDGLGGEGKFVKKLKVYGRGGKPCYRCRTILKRIKVGGRGTVYCPQCQK